MGDVFLQLTIQNALLKGHIGKTEQNHREIAKMCPILFKCI